MSNPFDPPLEVYEDVASGEVPWPQPIAWWREAAAYSLGTALWAMMLVPYGMFLALPQQYDVRMGGLVASLVFVPACALVLRLLLHRFRDRDPRAGIPFGYGHPPWRPSDAITVLALAYIEQLGAVVPITAILSFYFPWIVVPIGFTVLHGAFSPYGTVRLAEAGNAFDRRDVARWGRLQWHPALRRYARGAEARLEGDVESAIDHFRVDDEAAELARALRDGGTLPPVAGWPLDLLSFANRLEYQFARPFLAGADEAVVQLYAELGPGMREHLVPGFREPIELLVVGSLFRLDRRDDAFRLASRLRACVLDRGLARRNPELWRALAPLRGDQAS